MYSFIRWQWRSGAARLGPQTHPCIKVYITEERAQRPPQKSICCENISSVPGRYPVYTILLFGYISSVHIPISPCRSHNIISPQQRAMPQARGYISKGKRKSITLRRRENTTGYAMYGHMEYTILLYSTVYITA